MPFLTAAVAPTHLYTQNFYYLRPLALPFGRKKRPAKAAHLLITIKRF
jgi:hypothetical protein